MNFSSTLLAQTNDPKEIQKADLDLLAKVNQVAAALPTQSATSGTVSYVTVASMTSYVTGYAAPIPTSVIWQVVFVANTWTLPASGTTWAYFGFGNVSGAVGTPYAGVASAGVTIVSAAGTSYTGFVWKLA